MQKDKIYILGEKRGLDGSFVILYLFYSMYTFRLGIRRSFVWVENRYKVQVHTTPTLAFIINMFDHY